jgi:hypothetical protein
MQPEEVRDDTALRRALAASVIVKPTDLPACTWTQPFTQPCKNIAVLPQDAGGLLPAGGLLCPEHYNFYFNMLWETWWNRGPTPTEAQAAKNNGKSTSEIMVSA